MPWTIKAELTGLDDLYSAVSTFKRGAANRILRPAVATGCSLINKAAKQAAPMRQKPRLKLLKRSLGVKVATGRRSGVVYGVVGPRAGFKTMILPPRGTKLIPADPIYYAHLVHGGTRPHALGKGSRLNVGTKRRPRPGPQIPPMHPGAKANPFLARALNTVHNAVIAAMRQKIVDGIHKTLAKGRY